MEVAGNLRWRCRSFRDWMGVDEVAMRRIDHHEMGPCAQEWFKPRGESTSSIPDSQTEIDLFSGAELPLRGKPQPQLTH
jgi:hypothetical protein